MTLQPIPAKSYYEEIFNWYMGPGRTESETAVWNHYLESRGYTQPPAVTDAIKDDFRAFVSFYNSMGISAQSGNEEILATADQFYVNYMNSFFGNLPALVQKDIWNTFLTQKGYNASPADSQAFRSLFVQYVLSLQTQATTLEAATALTPQEESKRAVIYTVTDALSKYLQATQDLISNQSAVLLLLGEWQQEYTKMMQKIPTLTGGMPGTVKLGLDSNGKLTSAQNYTLGFGNISLQDVVNWGYAQACANPGTEISFGVPTTGMGAYSFKLITDPSGKKSVQISFQSAAVAGGAKQTIQNPIVVKDPNTIDPTTKNPIDLSIANANEAIGKGFISFLQGISGFTTAMSTPYLPDIAKWLKDRAIQYSPAYITFGNYTDSSITDPAQQFQITLWRYDDPVALPPPFSYGPGVYWNLTFKKQDPNDPTKSVTASKLVSYPTSESRDNPPSIDAIVTAIGEKTQGFQFPCGPLAIPGKNLGTAGSGWKINVAKEGDPENWVDTALQLEQSDAQVRGEVQAKLTQYSQNIQGIRDMLGSMASRQQSALNQAKDSLNQQADVFTSLIDTLDTVMKAIVRKS